jgi:hypothetical protein
MTVGAGLGKRATKGIALRPYNFPRLTHYVRAVVTQFEQSANRNGSDGLSSPS